MLDDALAALITKIHASGRRAVLEFAGAGSLGLAWLHAVAGSSRTLLEATDRYSPASMIDLLGDEPEKFVSREAAEAMALQAYRRAMMLTDGAAGCLGLACTATIATDRVKKGEHGCWVAAYDASGCHSYGLVIAKGARDRLGEEQLVSRLLVRALALAGGAGDLELGLVEDERVDAEQRAASDPIARLLAGEVAVVLVTPDGALASDPAWRGGVLSGSFNPLHAGHEQLAQAASVWLGQPVAFEIPVVNADKPTLGYAELGRRLAQFRGRHTVLLSRAPRFVDKAGLYPGSTFVLGYDTALRLLDPGYYDGEAGLLEALEQIRAAGCRFLVAGRLDDGVFHTLEDLSIPPQFAELFEALAERLFRSDLSSTAIREQAAGR